MGMAARAARTRPTRQLDGKNGVTKKRRASAKGTRSKPHPGRKNYTTKRGDKDFHRGGHDIREGTRKPFRDTNLPSGSERPHALGARHGGIRGALHGGRIRSGPAAAPQGLGTGGYVCHNWQTGQPYNC